MAMCAGCRASISCLKADEALTDGEHPEPGACLALLRVAGFEYLVEQLQRLEPLCHRVAQHALLAMNESVGRVLWVCVCKKLA